MTDKKKYIRRADHSKENPYVMVRRQTLQDSNLSYEARGMLAFILSQPDHWRVEPSELINEHCGRDKVYRILKELIEAHYIEHERSQDKSGKIRWGDYVVHETPYKPFPEKPYTVKPDTAKPDSKDSYNKESRTKEKRAPKVATPEPRNHLIDAYYTSMGFDAFDIGAHKYTKARMAVAGRMLKWSIPATCDEIKAYLEGRKPGVNYEFHYLEDDLIKCRLQKRMEEQKTTSDDDEMARIKKSMEANRLMMREAMGVLGNG